MKAQLSRNEDGQLYTLLGYKDEVEFIEINKIQFERLEEINSRLVDSQNKLLSEAIELSTQSPSVESIKNAKSESGCKGGLPCFRAATDCDHSAEVDFGVGSATCTALGWFPPSWAVCQGSVFLVYAAEKLSCASALDKCCGLSQPKQAD